MIIGDYKINTIEWGDFKLDGGAMFGVVPKPLWEKKIPSNKKNRIPMKARGLLLQGDNKNILIDLGVGIKEDEIFQKRYETENIYNADNVLSKFDLKASDITDVFITHLHFDHCGGATQIKNGKAVPVFENAKYYIQKQHWQSAISGEARDNASFFKRNFLPLFESNSLQLIEGNNGLNLKNISVKISNGHTKCQQHPFISDNKTKLFYCADIFPTSAHISPRWIMAYDNQPEITMKEKQEFLEYAVKENWILFFEHDPVIDACRVEKKDGKFIISEKILF